jgi:hypothetical protein
MKFLRAFCLVFLFIHCNEDKKQPAANQNNAVKRDTNTIRPTSINPYGAPDVSPMDVSYFPVDYPLTKMTNPGAAAPVMRVIYSRPHKQGRAIFGNLLKYGEPWRLGANEATEIEFFQPVTIQNKTISKGRYIMYCIPQENEWTIILNDNVHSWGLKQNPDKDVYRFKIATEKTPAPIEHFTIVFQPASKGTELVIAWDIIMARLPITI